MSGLAPIVRPNGKMYRPRKVVVAPWDNEGMYGAGWDCGVIVLGTHDIDRARPLAVSAVRCWFGVEYAVQPERVWKRFGYWYGNPAWLDDVVAGRAGVWWSASDDPGDGGGA